MVRGSRPLSDLTRHLKARADVSHATPDHTLSETILEIVTKLVNIVLYISKYELELVRFYADYRIKPHAPLLGLVSVNSFEF